MALEDKDQNTSSHSNDLRNRIFFTIFILCIYRLGTYVPLSGIDPFALKEVMSSSQQGLLGMFNVFSGGAVTRMAIFALGIMPYISASIIIQLLGAVVPYFQRLQKEGELGRRKIIQLTRYGTVIIASMQAIGVSVYLASLTDPGTNIPIVTESSLVFYFVTIITLVTGTIFIMWLGEQISDHGLGNGISLIIMCGILAQLPFILQIEWDSGNITNSPYRYLLLLVLMFLITLFVVCVTTGQRKIPVQYAKRVIGRKVYGGTATHIPLKICISASSQSSKLSIHSNSHSPWYSVSGLETFQSSVKLKLPA